MIQKRTKIILGRPAVLLNAAIVALCIIASALTSMWGFRWIGKERALFITGGAVVFQWDDAIIYYVGTNRKTLTGIYKREERASSSQAIIISMDRDLKNVSIPMWLPLVITANSWLCWRAAKRSIRARRHRCEHCGYRIVKNESVCPECGRATRHN